MPVPLLILGLPVAYFIAIVLGIIGLLKSKTGYLIVAVLVALIGGLGTSWLSGIPLWILIAIVVVVLFLFKRR